MTEPQHVCANATKVTEGRDQVALLFGMAQARQPGEEEITVQLSDRIVLSSSSAKQLSTRLGEVLHDHVQEFGPLDVEPSDQALLVAVNSTLPARHQLVIRWDDTRMTSTYVNATLVTGSREAIDIVFGIEQARQAGRNEVRVEPSRHVELSPSVTKQLAIDLEDAIGNHETIRRGREPAPVVRGTKQKVEPDVDQNESDKHIEKILTLFQQVGRLDTRVDFEQSFKAIHGRLFEKRFLLGINRRVGGAGSDERLVSIGENIGMPHNLLASFERSLPHANHVYFGVEEGEETLTLKAYLEFRDQIERQIDGADVAGQSFPLFAGFKWDSSSPSRQAVTEYVWYPSLPVPEMLERLKTTVDPIRHPELFEVVSEIVERASERISHGDIQYLEVTEEGNPRRSFDINIYKAGYRLEDLVPFLSKAMEHYAFAPERTRVLYDRIKTDRFGHLAGGVDRENRDFMTVYYGVLQVDSSQLASAQIV